MKMNGETPESRLDIIADAATEAEYTAVQTLLDAIADQALRDELETAIGFYYREAVVVAFRAGFDASTNPRPWLFAAPTIPHGELSDDMPVEKFDAAMDSATAATTKLLSKMCKLTTDRDLGTEIFDTATDLAMESSEAGFKLGFECATNPRSWIFGPEVLATGAPNADINDDRN